MKLILFTLLALVSAYTDAMILSSLTAISLSLLSFSTPASCFFGMFRSRRPTAPPLIETPSAPEGPISFDSDFPQRGGFNPFGMGAGDSNIASLYNSPSSGFSGQSRFPNQFSEADLKALQRQSAQGFPSQQSMQFQSGSYNMGSQDQSFSEGSDDAPPPMNTDEAESFFTLLSETDESKCISRLVCEMGANPANGGEFGQTISEIIGSLTEFPSGSKVSEYNQVLNLGRTRGTAACLSQYASCDQESYQLVKKAQVDDENEGK